MREKHDMNTIAKFPAHRLSNVYLKVQELLEREKSKRVLDFGAGDGGFLRDYLPACVEHAAYHDKDRAAEDRAKENFKGSTRIKIVRDVNAEPTNSYSAVVFIAVWMEVPWEREAIDILRTIQNRLEPQGHLFAAVTHPCFREEEFSTFRTDFDNEQYLRSGVTFTADVFDQTNASKFVDTHWSLESMSYHLSEVGLVIREIYEIADFHRPGVASRGAPWMVIDILKP